MPKAFNVTVRCVVPWWLGLYIRLVSASLWVPRLLRLKVNEPAVTGHVERVAKQAIRPILTVVK